MNSGVVSSFFSFPSSFLRWDSHSLIYHDTYRALQQVKPDFASFIKLKDVFRYDGGYGPDRLWVREEIGTSESYYNPLTGEGGALNRILEHYKRARDRAKENLPWEKDFTWMSHFIVDVLSPTHHFGRKIKSTKRRDNWEDPYFRAERPASFKNRHMIFEATINFWQVFGKRLKPKFEKLEMINGETLENFIKKKIEKIRALGLYEEFLAKGFSRQSWRKINRDLIPKIDYTLAVIWWSLYREVAASRRLEGKKI